LIFSGIDGVGKRRAAVAVAQALNCLAPARGQAETGQAGISRRTPAPAAELPLDACGTCSACRRIERGTHPDVILLEPDEKLSIKVDPVREVLARAGYRPFEGRRRAVIVDPADLLEFSAQNALLKALEEPPPATVFILVTSRPDTLLPTVRSRCPQLRFGRLAPAEIADALIARHGFGEPEARALAAVVDGSLGRALQAEAGDFVEVRSAAYGVLRDAASAPDPRGRMQSAQALGRKRPSAVSAGNERDDLAVHLRALGSLLREIVVLSARGHERALANLDLKASLEHLAGSYGRERALRAFTAVDRALGALERNASPKIVIDWLALQV
jgi:DNA polymerase-3 subunit delta'